MSVPLPYFCTHLWRRRRDDTSDRHALQRPPLLHLSFSCSSRTETSNPGLRVSTPHRTLTLQLFLTPFSLYSSLDYSSVRLYWFYLNTVSYIYKLCCWPFMSSLFYFMCVQFSVPRSAACLQESHLMIDIWTRIWINTIFKIVMNRRNCLSVSANGISTWYVVDWESYLNSLIKWLQLLS